MNNSGEASSQNLRNALLPEFDPIAYLRNALLLEYDPIAYLRSALLLEFDPIAYLRNALLLEFDPIAGVAFCSGACPEPDEVRADVQL